MKLFIVPRNELKYYIAGLVMHISTYIMKIVNPKYVRFVHFKMLLYNQKITYVCISISIKTGGFNLRENM